MTLTMLKAAEAKAMTVLKTPIHFPTESNLFIHFDAVLAKKKLALCYYRLNNWIFLPLINFLRKKLLLSIFPVLVNFSNFKSYFFILPLYLFA